MRLYSLIDRQITFIIIILINIKISIKIMYESLIIHKPKTNFIDKQRKRTVLQRTKTVGCENQENQSLHQYFSRKRAITIKQQEWVSHKSSLSSYQVNNKNYPASERPISKDPYEDQNNWLASQFISEFQKMNEYKDETYRNLRSKFVKKYPQFRHKYVSSGIDLDYSSKASRVKSEPIVNNTFLTQTIVQSNQHAKMMNKKPDPLKNIAFYSRSKKKCMTNNFEKQKILQAKGTIKIPHLTFIKYMRKKEHKTANHKKIKGINILKNREDILLLQKQGTKSYNKLKQCLQDAIDTCNTTK